MPIDFPNSPTNGDLYSAGGKNWQYNGSAWVLLGVVPSIPVGSVGTSELANSAVTQAKMASTISAVTICTSSTRPGSPFTGQTIFETNTGMMKVWLGSAWSNGTLHSQNLTIEYVVVGGGGGGGMVARRKRWCWRLWSRNHSLSIYCSPRKFYDWFPNRDNKWRLQDLYIQCFRLYYLVIT